MINLMHFSYELFCNRWGKDGIDYDEQLFVRISLIDM